MKGKTDLFTFLLCQKIGTWLTREDFYIMSYFLTALKKRNITGGILEVGTYKGGCIPVLASQLLANDELVLWDIFDNELDNLRNQNEVESSYEKISKSEIIRILESLRVMSYSKVIQDDSINLFRISRKNYFKMIHIDGSHLYEIVKRDLEFAIANLNIESGIIVVDDYRAQHCPGVAVAVWELVSKNDLKVIVLGPAKIYLSHPQSKWSLETISLGFSEMHLPHDIEIKERFKYISVKSSKDKSYRENIFIRCMVSFCSRSFFMLLKSREKP